MTTVEREAQVSGNKDWPKWMNMGNVTYSEAARRMAMWCYNFSKEKKLPNTLRILVRDKNGSGTEFPFDVHVKVEAHVTAIRGDE